MYYYVDHTCRFQRNTGIQRCVRAIAAALIQTAVPLRPLVWDRQRQRFAQAPAQALDHLARWSGPYAGGWASATTPAHWSDGWLLMVELASGSYAPSSDQLRAAADGLGLQVAWVFHDAIPLRLAHLYGPRGNEVARRHAAYMAGLARFERVMANSQTSAQHLRAFLAQQGVSPGQLDQLVEALPLASELPGVPRPSPQQARQSPSDPLRLLCVGSLEPRKNHVALFKAMHELWLLRRWQAELVLVGWANDQRVVDQLRRAQELGLPIQWEVEADDARLRALYDWCDATVYPSLEEGFGLPVAESLWQRRPCVCSGDGAIGEVARGGGCLLVNTADWRSLAAALERLMHQPTTYATLADGLAGRTMRTWHDYAVELLEDLRARTP